MKKQTPATALDILREFVDDIRLAHAPGREDKLDEANLDWPDLAVTYKKALAFLKYPPRKPKNVSKGYTVLGIYGDNQQPWGTFVESARSPKAAALKGIKAIYANGTNGVEREDIFVVDVLQGYANGVLCNDKILSEKDLRK